MTRFAPISMVLVLAPTLAAAQVTPSAVDADRPAVDTPERELVAGDPSHDVEGDDEDRNAGEEQGAYDDGEYDDGEYDEELAEADFCGGDEEISVVDLANDEMQSGNLARAREMLVTALREGRIDEWQRGVALATLAEAQLRSGHDAVAILNYRKALRVDPDGVGPATRVGLAVALHRRGARAAAYAEAIAARASVCDSEYEHVACFLAQWLIANTSHDDEERRIASTVMTELRATQPELAGRFEELEHLLEGGRARAGRS